MNVIIGSILVASVVSTLFWMGAGVLVRPLVRSQPLLHLITIYLSVFSFLLLNVFAISAILRLLNGTWISLLFGFMTGVQTVAGISAFLFVRRVAQLRKAI